MPTRISKIARLPRAIRDQLNFRLQNGEIGGALLAWLNQLPEVAEILASLFNAQPITKQNLSEWRRSGYQDWLRHQARQERIQRISEQGFQLQPHEQDPDPFESFSKIILAEMAEELESLHELTDRNERWNRLREISRDLVRLQNGHNHSKRVELAWIKWNDQFESESDEDNTSDVEPAQPPSENQTVAPSPTESKEEKPELKLVNRFIRHRQCGYGCVCKDCHPDDGEYPYAQAIKDAAEVKDPSHYQIGDTIYYVYHTDCDCYCGCPKSLAWERGERPPGAAI